MDSKSKTDSYAWHDIWIQNPKQIHMPGMTFVGGYPNEYCIFMDELSEAERDEIRRQIGK